MYLRPLLAMTLASCATATEVPREEDAGATRADARIDGSVGGALVDAGADAPSSSSTCAQATSGVLATWTFAGAPGNQTSTAAASTATGVNASPVSRVGVTATAGTGSINASGWPTATQRDLAKYYSFSITPPSGCELALTSLAIDARASATGPTQALVATSRDNYTATSVVNTTAASTPALTTTAAATAIELRVYGFGAAGSAGTFRLQTTLTVSGSLQ